MKETEKIEQDIAMRSFKSSVDQLFNGVRVSAEYKAVVAEALAHKWRSTSDSQINRALQNISRKEEEKHVDEQAGDPNILGK